VEFVDAPVVPSRRGVATFWDHRALSHEALVKLAHSTPVAVALLALRLEMPRRIERRGMARQPRTE
jgi:hypothetical protein